MKYRDPLPPDFPPHYIGREHIRTKARAMCEYRRELETILRVLPIGEKAKIPMRIAMGPPSLRRTLAHINRTYTVRFVIVDYKRNTWPEFLYVQRLF